MTILSIYDTQKHSKDGGLIDIDVFFNQIRTGVYRAQVEEIRLLKYNFSLEKERCKYFPKEEIQKDDKFQKVKNLLREKKGLIHRVTISGKFGETREATSLVAHTGLIDIDIDGLESEFELNSLKAKLINDDYCYACFVTCGGDGLSFICRIDPLRHVESWAGIKEYFHNKYSVSIDISHKSVANTRNASFDPSIFVRDTKSKIFKEYPKEKKEKLVQNRYIYNKSDFDEIISEIVKRRIDFCPSGDYNTYRNIGFSIASKFGEDGIYYFQSLCQNADNYSLRGVEKDYKWFCKNPNGGIKIATFYARCKEFNIETSSKKTARIATVASASMKGGKTKEATLENLVKFESFTKDECNDIVNQVFDDKIEFSDEKSILEEIEVYIQHNYDLRKNILTGKIENEGVEWNEEDLNGLFISVKKAYEKSDAKWIERIIFSPFVKSYHPIREWFLSNQDKLPDELLDKHEVPDIIKKLCRSLKTANHKYTEKYITKWLVGIVSSAFGEPSNLELDLTGELGKGKTYFFSHLLPKKLGRYFAKSNLDKGKDDEILMTQKLIILMDECGGKTRSDEKMHKRLLDMEIFSLRRPYGKGNEDILRLASLSGTSNPVNLQSDPHGNRRVIYINVIERDHEVYDSIDKDYLWMAVYHLWKNGFNWKILGDEINELKQNTLEFQDYSMEYELLTKYISEGEQLATISEIKVFIEDRTRQKLSISKLSNEIKRLGFKMINESSRNVYKVKFLESQSMSREDIAKASNYF